MENNKREYMIRWRAANRDKVQSSRALWAAKNGERLKSVRASWRAANPDKVRTMIARWRAANPDKVRAMKVRQNARLREKLIRETLTTYGGKCAFCGEIDFTILTLDHINGGGRKHRKALNMNGRSGHPFYLKLRSLGFPHDPPLQILCTPCHIKKDKRTMHFTRKLKNSPQPLVIEVK